MLVRSAGRIIPFLLVLLLFGCGSDPQDQTPQPKLSPPAQTIFDLTDVDERHARIHFVDGHLHGEQIAQPNILIHLFSPDEDTERVMLPWLSRLQRQHAQDLFVIGITLPHALDPGPLRHFMRRNGATFFIARSPDNVPFAFALLRMVQWSEERYPLPMTFLFRNGTYVTHYEGLTPIEMIRNDLTPSPTTAKGDTRP